MFATGITKKKIGRATRSMPEEYRERWVIETGYRVIGKASGTTSINHAMRIFLLSLALINANMWMVTRLLCQRRRKKHRRLTMDNFLAVVCSIMLGFVRTRKPMSTGPGPPG